MEFNIDNWHEINPNIADLTVKMQELGRMPSCDAGEEARTMAQGIITREGIEGARCYAAGLDSVLMSFLSELTEHPNVQMLALRKGMPIEELAYDLIGSSSFHRAFHYMSHLVEELRIIICGMGGMGGMGGVIEQELEMEIPEDLGEIEGGEVKK